MKKVCVNATGSYEVLIGNGLLSRLGEYVKTATKAARLALISDSNVWPFYGKAALQALHNAGYTDVFHFVFPAGEQSKNMHTYFDALNFLAEKRLTRTDCIIALGGGVVGDLAGFTAACYLRGIDYIQVPTSLLACVDSSVGGKTAIDLPAGKNLVGAFHQPKLVLCDLDLLNTLPDRFFIDGCAEIIKYAILYDEELFQHLADHGTAFDRQWVIHRCISLKRDVVACDEFDKGARQLLNFGHTIGHGIEADSNFKVSHGHAVAMGMSIVSRASVRFKLCDENTSKRVRQLISSFDLPTETDASAAAIFANALSDKKRSADTVNLIVPQRIGKCALYPVDLETLKEFIEAGL